MADLSLAILVVEDEQLMWELVEDALVDGGFEAELATTGEEAVTLLQGTNSKYRAVVTDINLPGTVDGWEVARRARAIDPNFPIVYTCREPAPTNGQFTAFQIAFCSLNRLHRPSW
ncbi:response regulator [Bradyrhizobium sp. 177]|uniref:response regulator n=1 Tax=Bradyrhizobium sp. 177 TaxID=2782647 RepID=UPI003211B81D